MAAFCTRCSALGMAVFVLSCLSSGTPIASATGKPKLESGYENIRFYIQEQANVTYFPVVPPVPGHGFFGNILVGDENATKTPDPASAVVARVKSLVVAVNNDEFSNSGFDTVSTIVFEEASGYGSGSTISFQGFLNDLKKNPVLSITGGTGKFLLGRGWIDTSFYFLDMEKGIDIRETTVHVFYGKW